MLSGSVQPLRDRFPRLFSFALDYKISVKDFLNSNDPHSFFALPLSIEAMDELNDLQLAIANMSGPDLISLVLILPKSSTILCIAICLWMSHTNGFGKADAP